MHIRTNTSTLCNLHSPKQDSPLYKSREYQVWQEGIKPKLIQSHEMMITNINYVHNNPIKRGYIDVASHWRYSSARDNEDVDGLLEIERFW